MHITLLCIFLLWPVRVWKGKERVIIVVFVSCMSEQCVVWCVSVTDPPFTDSHNNSVSVLPVCVWERHKREVCFQMTACQFFSHWISKQMKHILRYQICNACKIFWCVFLYEKIYFWNRKSTVSSNQICTSRSFPCWNNFHIARCHEADWYLRPIGKMCLQPQEFIAAT